MDRSLHLNWLCELAHFQHRSGKGENSAAHLHHSASHQLALAFDSFRIGFTNRRDYRHGCPYGFCCAHWRRLLSHRQDCWAHFYSLFPLFKLRAGCVLARLYFKQLKLY